MLINCNALLSIRYNGASKELKKHISFLVELKKDLETVFRRIRLVELFSFMGKTGNLILFIAKFIKLNLCQFCSNKHVFYPLIIYLTFLFHCCNCTTGNLKSFTSFYFHGFVCSFVCILIY